MRQILPLLPLTIACTMVAACGSRDETRPQHDDGFSGGTLPLVLPGAAPGLCEGAGTKKECATPGGCAGSPGTGGAAGYANGSGGSAMGGGCGSAGASGAGPLPGPGGSSQADAGDCDAGPEAGPGACDDAGAEFDATAQWSAPQATPAACEGLDTQSPAKLFLSADDSSSMAAPVIARRLIRLGDVVPASVVRPYEFFNYYSFDFAPAPAEQVRIVPQLSGCEGGGELAFQVALQAEARSTTARRPLNLTFVLDTSGSMASTVGGSVHSIDLERAAVLAIASQLRAGDVVSMVTWDVIQNDVLSGHAVTGPNDPKVVAAAHALTTNGGTNLHAGLVRGYELAELYHSDSRINRVILISDGRANVGITDADFIAAHADDEEGEEGIYLAGIGVGDGVNDTLMNVVTDRGRGAYVYLDSLEEAERMLAGRFLEVVDIAARAVRLEVTLPWYLKVHKFYGEQISTDPTQVRPQHLGPNDAMLFFQTLRACDPSRMRADDRIVLRATWETPLSREKKSATIDTTLSALGTADPSLHKAAAIAGYAEALRAAATAPSNAEKVAAIDRALGALAAAPTAKTDPDLIEIGALLRDYRQRFTF